MRYGYIKTNPFQYIVIKKVDGKRDFLSVEELNLLSETYFSNQITDIKEKEVLRYFLFSCYTGLRYSDLKALKTSSIKGKSVQINMHKTNILVNIPLSQKALFLLQDKNEMNVDSVFHVYCNKVTNKILKRIGL